ncbi:benzoate transport protein [alpha proteobacterium BAL199]|jgi:benzoate membrane transport protein|nr:benzoate transport protein [alpha proteobacterium BAL199]
MTDQTTEPPGSALQLLSVGLLTATVGFASAFTIVLQGLASAGASPAEAASGLLALCIAQGLVAIWLSVRMRMPISIAWSTPGAVLLIATGMPDGGFPEAVGAFLISAILVVAAGLWKPFARAVSSIPPALSSAMLAGVLLDLCLAPMRAVGAMPELALPIVLAWAISWRYARSYAVPIAVLVTVGVIAFATEIPEGILKGSWPTPVLVTPIFSVDAAIGIALPLFIVTMAAQNLPGLAVMNANGYQPPVRPIFVATGLASAAGAPFGGHAVNLAAITAALCAGPDAHPDPSRRWIASTIAGAAYVVIGLFAGVAAAFVTASPPLLIQAVAGLALFGSLGAAAAGAFVREEDRLPAVLTFVTTASGLSFFGIGAAFWGLIAGGILLLLSRVRRPIWKFDERTR